jgi:dolichyl-diphosphooligosaccharide--protein glycosyltransferase
MVYWSRRATINDGSLHGGLRTVINAMPLAADTPRLAARLIHFYVARGLDGFQKVFAAAGRVEKGMALIRGILAAPPEQVDAAIAAAGLPPNENWREFFFPVTGRPVYLYLDLRLARTAYWWSWFGTWDVARREGRHAIYQLFPNCVREADTIKGRDIAVDLARGTIRVKNRTYALKETRFLDDTTTRVEYENQPRGLVLVYRARSKTAHLMQPPFEQTLFSRLYLLNQPDSAFFSLRHERWPYYQVWQVNPQDR